MWIYPHVKSRPALPNTVAVEHLKSVWFQPRCAVSIMHTRLQRLSTPKMENIIDHFLLITCWNDFRFIGLKMLRLFYQLFFFLLFFCEKILNYKIMLWIICGLHLWLALYFHQTVCLSRLWILQPWVEVDRNLKVQFWMVSGVGEILDWHWPLLLKRGIFVTIEACGAQANRL